MAIGFEKKGRKGEGVLGSLVLEDLSGEVFGSWTLREDRSHGADDFLGKNV